jgi:hypothetical protein
MMEGYAMKTKKSPAAWAAMLLLVSLSGAAFCAENPASLRQQIAKTEQEFFALYNTLNTDPQYEMVCKMERETGSPFAKRVCQPRFFQATQQATAANRMQAAVHGGLGAEASTLGSAPSFWQDDGFRRHMLEVLQKSPKLKALGEKRDALQIRLDELTKK